MDNEDPHGGAGGQKVLEHPAPGVLSPTAARVTPSGDPGIPATYLPPHLGENETIGHPYQNPVQAQPFQPPAVPAAQVPRQSNTWAWVLAIVVGVLVLLAVGVMLLAWITAGAIGYTIKSVQTVDLRTETQSVALGDANSADVSINMGAGNVTVSGGATDLMDATFMYNVAEWKPTVNYNVSGGQGTLTVDEPSNTGIGGANTRYDWNLKLNNNVPMDLKIHSGVGNLNAHLGGMNLKSVDVGSGTGNMLVDLRGAWQNSANITISGGVGNTTVQVPADTGVRIVAKKGLGNINVSGLNFDGTAYTNNAYNNSPVKLNVDLSAGIGQVTLESSK